MSKSRNSFFSPIEKVAGIVGGVILVLALGGLMLASGQEPNGSIHGRIVAGDTGIEGAQVGLWSHSSAGYGPKGELVASVETGPTGRFVFRDVRPGEYSVVAGQEAGASQEAPASEARVASDGVTSITLAAR